MVAAPAINGKIFIPHNLLLRSVSTVVIPV